VQHILLIEQYVREVMGQVAHPDLKLAHDFNHVDRVRRWALIIAQQEGYANLDLVEAAALLHDIGLAFVEHRRDHAHVGAERAAQFLTAHHLFLDTEISTIADAIRSHSALTGGGILGTILRDADMLDLFGAIGIMRACTSKYALPEYDTHNVKGDTWALSATNFTDRFTSGIGTGLFIVDQLNFQISCYGNLGTASAKAAAQPLVAFMKAYLLQLELEIVANQPPVLPSAI
jgi:HD superfamily phosphodiesterase